ncbi:hypothetical protein OAJ98_02280 [Deltaproteobacteria bacterium]|nr:hypothetical protein [Deltaproteobacteria bacterium]
MTLREMLPEWWCKFSLSLTEHCGDNYGQVNWGDFTLGETFFTGFVIFIILIVFKLMDS